MAKLKKQHIVIIGCGNVAWHIAKHLSKLKNVEVTVYNHKANRFLNEFKTKLRCTTHVGLNQIITGADFYFICGSVGSK